MLTIFAWIVFIPSVFWNMVFFGIAFANIIESKNNHWLNQRNFRDALLSLAILFIPGVYLFGWF